ncbi:uncharacterized protein [Anabrus simplex]
MADGRFYEDVDVGGNNGFIIPSVTKTFQLPYERDTLLRLIEKSSVPVHNKKKFKQFCCQLVNVPLDDEVVRRVWNFLFENRYEDKDGTGWSKNSQKGVMHANTNHRESSTSGKQNMELTSSVVKHMMEKDSNRESGVHRVDQECLNTEAASKDDTSHEMTSEKSKTSNGHGSCKQYLSLKSEPLSEDDISYMETSVKSEPILDLVPCSVEPISYKFEKFYSDPSESKFVCQERSISKSLTDFNLYPTEQHNLNSVYQNDDLAEKTSPDVADPFITFRFVLDPPETNTSVSPHESTLFVAAKPVGNVIENIPQIDCQIHNCSELMDSNLSSKTSFHENGHLIEVNEKESGVHCVDQECLSTETASKDDTSREMTSLSKENGAGKKDRKKDRIVNQTVDEVLVKCKKSVREDDKNKTTDSINVLENSAEVREKKSPRKGSSPENSFDVGKKQSVRKRKSSEKVAVSEDLPQNRKTKKHKLEDNKDDSSEEFERTSSVVLDVSSKGRKKNRMTEHKSGGENSGNRMLNKKKSNSQKYSVGNNEHHSSPERSLGSEGHKSSNIEKVKGKLLNSVLKKKKKQAKKLKMKEELEILRNVMEVLVDQISQLPQTHKAVISNALIKKTHSLEKSNSEECNNTTDECIRKRRKKNNHNELDNNSRTENENQDIIKQRKKHKINRHRMSSNTAEDNSSSTESCKKESNYSGIQSSEAKVKIPKKKKKKHKKAHRVDTCSPDHMDVSYKTEVQTVDNQTQVIQKKLKNNRRRPSKLSASICDTSEHSSTKKVSISGPDSLDYSSGIESDCSVKRVRFPWKEVIIEILRAHLPFGLPYCRLQKKVIKKYSKERGRISSNTTGKFERYLSKIPGVVIHQNNVMLSEPASEKAGVTEKKKKQRNIVIQKVVKTTKYLLTQ